jgi:hypothetical protein
MKFLKNISLVISALVLSVALFFYFGPQKEGLPVSEASPSAQTKAMDGSAELSEPRNGGEEKVELSESQASTVSIPTTLDEFYQSTDLLKFIEKWESQVGSDPEITYAVGLALEECRNYQMTGDKFALAANEYAKWFPESAVSIRNEFKRHIDKCSSLISIRSLKDHPGNTLIDKAAQLGDKRAQAMRMRTFLAEHGWTATRDRVRELLDSRDPRVLIAMADFIALHAKALGPPGSTISRMGGDLQYSSYLAACRMGLDCSSNSQMMRLACLSGMPCSAVNMDEMFRMMLSPNNFRRTRELSSTIAEHLKAGAAPDLFSPQQ